MQKLCHENVGGIFDCKDGNGCVISQFLEDGINDCVDGSDEGKQYIVHLMECPNWFDFRIQINTA